MFFTSFTFLNFLTGPGRKKPQALCPRLLLFICLLRRICSKQAGVQQVKIKKPRAEEFPELLTCQFNKVQAAEILPQLVTSPLYRFWLNINPSL